MHIAASPIWESWSELSTRLPCDLDLDELARTSNAIQRHRGDGVSDGATLLRLSLARGPGGKSLQDTAVWAHLNGLASLTGQSLNERLHRVVELRFFAGLNEEEIAGVLNVSARTVERDWVKARLYLSRELGRH